MQTSLQNEQQFTRANSTELLKDNQQIKSCHHIPSPLVSILKPAPFSILLVDDEPNIRFLIKKMLTHDGHQVFEAGDGAEGLEQHTILRPDLIVLDISMPRIDGLTVLHEIRMKDGVVGIILVSAIKRKHLAVATFTGRADGFILKPFHLADLCEEIQRVGALVNRRR